MPLSFEATAIVWGDAIDGELLQVCFDTAAAVRDEAERCTPYVLILRNFEFPGAATIEWYDGQDYDGGADIASVSLSRTRVAITLRRGMDIEVTFRITEKEFTRLKTCLTRMIDGLICSEG